MPQNAPSHGDELFAPLETFGRAGGRGQRPSPNRRSRQCLLRDAGLVVTRNQGTASICELNGKPLRAVNEWLRDYEAFWGENLRNLKR